MPPLRDALVRRGAARRQRIETTIEQGGALPLLVRLLLPVDFSAQRLGHGLEPSTGHAELRIVAGESGGTASGTHGGSADARGRASQDLRTAEPRSRTAQGLD